MPLTLKSPTLLKTARSLKLGSGKPSFASLLGDHPAEVADNPLDMLDYPADLEGKARAELDAVQSFIRDERKVKRDAYRVLVDHEYWLCICFQSRAQKEEFLAKAGWADLGEKYVDGLALAELLGVDVRPVPLTTKAAPKSPKSLREEVMDDA